MTYELKIKIDKLPKSRNAEKIKETYAALCDFSRMGKKVNAHRDLTRREADAYGELLRDMLLTVADLIDEKNAD